MKTARARVFRATGHWEWRCRDCANFGGGSREWQWALYGAHLHLNWHRRGLI